MLGWLFKRKSSDDASEPTPSSPAGAARVPELPPAPAVDWSSRLSRAQGDDTALLEIAGAQAPIEVRLGAIEAIAGEDVLKQAERTFRDRDRRLARAAKQRHAALAAQRESRAQAVGLIESARALAGQAVIPLNRLADLDRAWQALDPSRLEPAQRDNFAAAIGAVSSLVRERGDAQLKGERWAARARDVLSTLQGVTAGAAAGTRDRSQLAEASDAAREVLASPEGTGAGLGLADALQQALQAAEQVDERIVLLDALPDPADDATAQAAPDAAADPEPRWQACRPLADATLRDALDARFAAWRHARLDARYAVRAQRAEQAKANQRAARQEDAAALDAALALAEQAVLEGQLDAAERCLGDVASLASRAGLGEAQRNRIGAAQADFARLKGWRQWGGGVAREELVTEAEALAAVDADGAAPPAPPQPRPQLSIKERSESIARLRAAWKELDSLGGAGGGALWRRFDDALTAAYRPVAAHTAAQRAAREANLAMRRQMLDALEAVALPGIESEAETDWKSIAQTLDRWLAEWRKLGPIEHTVPREHREALLARTRDALGRLEVPLGDARQAAQATREQLIARARRLADEAASGAPGRDLTGRVRELQAEWQQQARTMPLARAAEAAAWAEFRAAIDAVFSARAAASSAFEAGLQANAAGRSAVIDRLDALPAGLAPAALRRELADAQAAWQRAGPPPRDAAAALEGRYRAARDATMRRVAEAEQARHRAEADALREKLVMCEVLEGGEPAVDRAGLAERWNALPTLRSAWEQALAHRAGLAAGKPPMPDPARTDDLLLQLEASLGLASPSELQEARRALKLQAMKAALEGRGAVAGAGLPADELAALLLARRGLDAGQRERLARALDAMHGSSDT